MRVAVIGAGAMGGLWAARLAAAHNQVVVVDVAPEIVSAIQQRGLSIESPTAATQTVGVEATSRPEEAGIVDLAFVFVKAQHTAAAARSAQCLVGPNTIVCSLQNGWGNADTLAEVYPPHQLVVGLTYYSATLLAPGRISHTGSGPTFVGPYMDGTDLARSETVARCLTLAGIDTRATADVKTEIWKKLILNAGTLPTAALTRLRAGELGQAGPMRDLVDALACEAIEVARAQGFQIDASERLERIHATLEGAGQGKPSMLQDVEAGRKTEIEVINGAVVRAARRLGLATPLNEAMVALIGGLERAQVRP